MTAEFRDGSGAHHHDKTGDSDGGEPMRYEKRDGSGLRVPKPYSGSLACSLRKYSCASSRLAGKTDPKAVGCV